MRSRALLHLLLQNNFNARKKRFREINRNGENIGSLWRIGISRGNDDGSINVSSLDNVLLYPKHYGTCRIS